MFKSALLAGAAVLTLATAGAANAAIQTWDFTGGPNSDGSTGNTRTFTSSQNSIGVDVTAWWSSSTNNAALSTAKLGWYSPGLGVLSSNDTSHTVDNNDRTDVVIFHFDQAIDINSITLTSYGDADIQVWFGNSFVNNSINGDFGLTDLGTFTCNNSCNGNGEVLTYDINASNLTGTWLVIAADPSGDNDEFKIRGLSASYSPPTDVAEPGTLAVLGLGLAGLGLLRRRQNTAG